MAAAAQSRAGVRRRGATATTPETLATAPAGPRFGLEGARYPRTMTRVEFFVDPSCPWAWVTACWVRDVAPQRDLEVTWRSHCIEIRDDYGVAATMPEEYRAAALTGHALSHRMLRIFEAARVRPVKTPSTRSTPLGADGSSTRDCARDDGLLAQCILACNLDADLIRAADDERWDAPIVDSMNVAYAFGGPKTQTPTIVVYDDPPHGFKGPVMAPAPTGAAAPRGCGTQSTCLARTRLLRDHAPAA